MSNVLKGVKFDSNIDWYKNNPRYNVIESTKFCNVGVLPKQAVVTDKINVLSKSIRHMPYFKIAGYIDGISDGDDYIKLDGFNHIYFNAMYEFSNEELKSLVDSGFYHNDISTVSDFFNESTRLVVPLKMNFASVYDNDKYQFTYVGLDPSNYTSGHIVLDMNSLGQSLIQYMAIEMAEHKTIVVDRGLSQSNGVVLSDELINANKDLKLLLESVSGINTDVTASFGEGADISSLLDIFNNGNTVGVGSEDDKDSKGNKDDITKITDGKVSDNTHSVTADNDINADSSPDAKLESDKGIIDGADINSLLGLFGDDTDVNEKKDKTDPPQDAYLYDKDRVIGKDIPDYDKAVLSIYQNIFGDEDISGTFADDKARELS